MLHFFPNDSAEPVTGAPYAEAVARLASIRRALSLVEDFSGGAEDFASSRQAGPVALGVAGSAPHSAQLPS